MRKRNCFTLILLLAAFLLHAQSTPVVIYGFRQQTTGGMQKQGDIDETGKSTRQPPKQVFHYAIYLTSASKARIYPVQLWINGAAYAVKSEPFANNQAVPSNVDAPVTTLKWLLPDTVQNALKLTPLPLSLDKSGGRAKALAINNDVVVLYKQAGKLHYGVLKKFTDLDPVVLQ